MFDHNRFRSEATQFRDFADGYAELGLTAPQAAAWANCGFTPGEAKPWLEAGFGPISAWDHANNFRSVAEAIAFDGR